MSRNLRLLAIAPIALALGGVGSAAAADHSTAAASRAGAKVRLVHTKLGRVLADGSGRTVYIFGKDKGRRSRCFHACAAAWPPLTTHGRPVAGHGVRASKLGTTKRGHGVRQVTYNGHPLYGFVNDSGRRQTHGEGVNAFGGIWHVVSRSGKAAGAPGS